MKTRLTTLCLISLLGVTGTTTALAQEGYNYEGGSLNWLRDISQQASTPESVRLERESQKNWDRDVGNHMEGVGGHALYELKKMKPASPEQIAEKRQNEKTLDRGKDNHEEGTGGHGLYEATKS